MRTAVVAESGSDEWVLPGEVRARYETRLSFRLPGQMLARKVEVGERVKAGQAVAVIDARDAQLAEASVADAASRTYAARISLMDEDGALAIGMSAELRIRADNGSLPPVPLSALFHRNGKPAVWVLDGDRVRLFEVSAARSAATRLKSPSSGSHPYRDEPRASAHQHG